MSRNSFTSALAILLTVTIIAPSAFFAAPPRAHAQLVVADIPTEVKTAISAIQETLTQVHTYTSMIAEQAQYVNTYVLQPLAFVLSGNLMKMLTAGVIAFVIGKANGTGVPQFVTDINLSMRTVEDGPALAYLKQVGTTNSPFSYSIASALNTDYLTKTSLLGFWNANMCNLAATSQNVPGYLAGNWSQGGVAAWFALTTQVQNNPYLFYHNTQSQLANVVGSGVGGASGARLAQLNWGQGFLSWCGGTVNTTAPNIEAATAYATCKQNGNTDAQCQAASNAYLSSGSTSGIVNPGDPCTNSDGTQGTIQTPGSTIKSSLDKVLGGQQDQITRLGNVGPEINSILGNIATTMQTVNFASTLLGGSSGLLHVGTPSGTNSTSQLAQFTPTQTSSGAFTSGYLGASQSSIYQSTASNPSLNGTNTLSQITQYQNAWGTINTAATTAENAVDALGSYCEDSANSAATDLWNTQYSSTSLAPTPTQADLDSMHSPFIDAARALASSTPAVVTTEIDPIFAQVDAANASAAVATVFVQKYQTELQAGTDTASISADFQTLQSMPPTGQDVSQALTDAQVTGTAVAIPSGSLTISTTTSSSLVDQMNLLTKNANALEATCTLPTTFASG